MRLISAILALAFTANVSAECPNACSGHGTCALHDQCECCRNFGGADCSERICPFGNAHVDTPKGDIDGSTGTLSGPGVNLIVGSNVYPFGTTEQYPDLDVDEGHAYMECSNKGLCNREEGICDCFPGYEGTACQRASCPNGCSGHGTCETIKELAEDKEDGDLSIGAYGEQGYASYAAGTGDLSGVGNLKYELWDKALTMGCKCDPGFTGPDCSLKLCRYGVDPLFIPSTHSYSPVLAIEDDGLSPSAPHYEKAFVEIIAKDYVAADTSYNMDAASQMSGNFDLVIYDVYGEKYVLDKLKYAHFDEISAGLGGSDGGHYAGANSHGIGGATEKNQGFVGYGVNHTTCEEIMSYFPNDRIKDTTMGSFQNQMKHRGGLVSTAYVSGTTKPFCSVSAPRGQNVSMYADLQIGTSSPAVTEIDGDNNAAANGANSITGIAANEFALLRVGDLVADGSTDAGLGIDTACGGANGCYISDVVSLGSGGILILKLDGTAPTLTDGTSQKDFVVTRPAAGLGAKGTFHTADTADSIMGGTFGIRYNFDYNRGNPGYHKDLYVENVIPELGGPHTQSYSGQAGNALSLSDRPYVPVTAYYGVIQQGEVAEYKGDMAEDRPATSYDVTLPGYITDITPDPNKASGGDTITFSTDLSSYLAGLHDHGFAEADWHTPDHKTNKIKILNRYYMIASTKRILVTAKVPTRSDYEIGEYDAPTNATLGKFVTQAKLIDDTEPVKAYAQYWQANGVAAGMKSTCTCEVKFAVGAGAESSGTSITLASDVGQAGFDNAAIRAGMKIEAVANKIDVDTYVIDSGNADDIVSFPKTVGGSPAGTKVYLSKAILGDVSSTTYMLVDDTYDNGGGVQCLGCPHHLPLEHEETINAATSGYAYNGRVDYSELNNVYKSIENTWKSTKCGQFTQTVSVDNASPYTSLTLGSVDSVRIGQEVTGIGGTAGTENARVIKIDGATKVITLDRATTTQPVTATTVVTFKSAATSYASSCENAFDSMVNGKLMSGTAGYTPDIKLTVKAKLWQPYQYVSECSNRGACDRETGLCMCFTGYTHDNCDTQTPVC